MRIDFLIGQDVHTTYLTAEQTDFAVNSNARVGKKLSTTGDVCAAHVLLEQRQYQQDSYTRARARTRRGTRVRYFVSYQSIRLFVKIK